MKVIRAVVNGRVRTVNTDYSEDELPLDTGSAEVLLTWKRRLGAERKAQRDFNPLVGLDLVLRAPPRPGNSTPLRRSGTTFVPLAAALWSVRVRSRSRH